MARILEAVNSAPSVFNQRPWDLEAVSDDRVELYAAPDRVLGALLPREVTISCGTALYNLRLAFRVAGRTPSVWRIPGLDRESPLLYGLSAGRTLIASVEEMPGRTAPPTPAEEELYEALWLRRTNRWPYILPVPLPLLVAMEVAAAAEDGWLRLLHRRETRLMLRAAARADEWLANEASPRLRAELDRLNKVPASRYGPRPADTKHGVTRPAFWLPDLTARFESPQLMALSTDDDRPLDWLRAGEALQHALLTATRFSISAPYGRSARYRAPLQYGLPARRTLRASRQVPARYGVTASLLTQSLERADLDPDRRPRRWPWRSYYPEVPQVVLRVGYAPVEQVPMPGLRPAEPPRMAPQ